MKEKLPFMEKVLDVKTLLQTLFQMVEHGSEENSFRPMH